MSKSKLSAVAQSHVIVLQPIKGVVGLTVPALYINSKEQPHLVHSLIDYFLAFPDRSMTWMRQRSRALGLFYDFCNAHRLVGAVPNSYRELVARFAISIANGTINPATAEDELQLYWPPSSIDTAKRTTDALQTFIEWASFRGLISEKLILKKNELPDDERTYLKYMYQAHKAKSFAFLGHTLKTSEVAKSIGLANAMKQVHLQSKPAKTSSSKVFPNELIAPLITSGFIKNPAATTPWEREDITAKMITLLLLFGGTRHSEPYHLWFNDVVPQTDGTCKVFLRHPSEALTFLPAERTTSRKQYLAQTGLMPRNNNSCSKSYKAGWKDLQVNEDMSAAVQFIYPAAEAMFRELYIIYIKHYRPKHMTLRKAQGGYSHPFLFINNWSHDIGAPYSMTAYRKALSRAYRRINKLYGLKVSLKQSSGTAPHGMRHYYGQALTELGLDQKIIQKCMRHRTIAAQSVYTEPNADKIKSKLDEAMKKTYTMSNPLTSLSTFSTKNDNQ